LVAWGKIEVPSKRRVVAFQTAHPVTLMEELGYTGSRAKFGAPAVAKVKNMFIS
jgi:hypothetical protein